MATRKYLDPAYSIIREFGPPGGSLADAIDAVAAITGRNRTRVYRWMRPKEKGGTGGYIPRPSSTKIYNYARKKKMPITAGDFFGEARAA